MSQEEHISALEALGFTRIEALVYGFLVRESPATGYRISLAIGKSMAHTYKAVSSLETKGAVLTDDGATRLCRAVPADELLSALSRGFSSDLNAAAEALAGLSSAEPDQRVYRLKTIDQTLERARSLIRGARGFLLLDIFPTPLEELRPDIRDAAARGVTVGAIVYSEADLVSLPGVIAVVGKSASEVRELLDGEYLAVVADASGHVVALLDYDRRCVRPAVWSDNTFLSCLQHDHLAESILLAETFRIFDLDQEPALDAARNLSIIRARPEGWTAATEKPS